MGDVSVGAWFVMDGRNPSKILGFDRKITNEPKVKIPSRSININIASDALRWSGERWRIAGGSLNNRSDNWL